MAHLEQMLFANPRKARPASDTAGLEILAAGRQLGEIELVGSRIKRLLLEGDATSGGGPVPPDDIAVVFRRPQEVGDLVGEVFRKLGIPYALQSGRPLGRAPLLATLVALLRLDADDWPMPDLLAILGNNYLGAGLTAGVERTIRGLQIPRGRERLIERLAMDRPESKFRVSRAPLAPREEGHHAERDEYRVCLSAQVRRGSPDPAAGRPKVSGAERPSVSRAARSETGHNLARSETGHNTSGLRSRSPQARGVAVRPTRPAGQAPLGRWSVAWPRPWTVCRIEPPCPSGLKPGSGWPSGWDCYVPPPNLCPPGTNMPRRTRTPGGRLQAAVADIHRVSRWLGQEKGTVPFSAHPEGQADENRDRKGTVPFSSDENRDSPPPCAETGRTACAGSNISELPRLDRRQALAELVDILGSEPMAGGGEEWGRVRVLSAAGARGLRIPYLFMAGLSEKSFPAPVPENRVYSEPERQRLIEEGLPLATRNDRQADEMLLFYEVLACATRRLYFSYPAADESGEPLLPSPFLNEVEQACGAGRIARSEKLDLSPVPDDDRAASWEAFRLRAVSRALEGDVAMLAGLAGHDAAAADNLLAGLEIVARRQDRRRFGPAEGMLGSDTWPALAAIFAPQRIFSATELERYATCPYRYFLERLLKIEPLEDLALEIDSLKRGAWRTSSWRPCTAA